MKGIILAGGSGTRLYPITKVVSKQLLPIYDKPMIFYPLSTLMLAGIKDILIISTPEDTPRFDQLLGDGQKLGLNISYEIQPSPNGLAEAFIIGENFIGDDGVCLILGDNIFYGHGLSKLLSKGTRSILENNKALVFGYGVKDPQRYGVVSFEKSGRVKQITEKPKSPDSRYAVVGLYFYPNDVIELAKTLKPSKRGELEISALNQIYLNKKRLELEIMGRGYAWLDTGTKEAMNNASNFIKSIEDRQSLKISCLEEIAYRKGFIDIEQLKKIAEDYPNEYGRYLKKII
ncbi:MAG: glucose-1-phosphate thymidylyltransferase [Candidatus Marinimicrobia bacterium]|nr:glucose-1-phosphate thymidylyltransferase [Candidatus Neomarinimicrobiota bacterium]